MIIEKKNIVKTIIIAVLILVNLVLLSMFGSMQTTFTSIKLVYADNQEEIPSVNIVSNGNIVATTDSSGNALIKTSDLGEEITLVSDDTYQSKVSVSELNPDEPVRLLRKGTNYISGTLKSNANLSSVAIEFDGETFDVESSGEFILSTQKVGDLDITISSDGFIQRMGHISVSEGINTLPNEIEMTVAGSLFFKNRSYVEEELVEGIQVEAESINSKLISYSEEETKILGMIPGKEYFIRITADNINTREYVVTASNVPTPFGNVRLVESGHYPLLTSDTTSKLQLVDYDGQIETTLIDSNRIDIYHIGIDNEEQLLWYRSNENTARNIFPVNQYSIETGAKKIITDTNQSLLSGDVYVNYNKDIIITNSKVDSKDTLKLYTLKGEFVKNLYTAASNTENIDNVLIAADGKTILAEMRSRSENSAYLINLETAEVFEIARGDLNILSIDNSSTNFVYRLGNFIRSFNYPNRQDTELAIRDVGENFQFDNTDDGILYFTLNDVQIMKYRFDTNFVEEIISFNKLNEFDTISQEREYIFTISNKLINIFSKNAPTKFKTLYSK